MEFLEHLDNKTLHKTADPLNCRKKVTTSIREDYLFVRIKVNWYTFNHSSDSIVQESFGLEGFFFFWLA
uniref:Uncharacterized protein MANES_04G016200 n=1 Tax=Rhizophora mucronata TaxID=61149 RepID=A0A2P2L815_RHIMU